MVENIPYRDTLFRDFFKDLSRLITLSNALSNTEVQDINLIRLLGEHVNFFSKMKSDISFLIGNLFINIIEH